MYGKNSKDKMQTPIVYRIKNVVISIKITQDYTFNVFLSNF